MITFTNKPTNPNFLSYIKSMLDKYLNTQFQVNKMILQFEREVFFKFETINNIINIKCFSDISEIDFVYNLILNLKNEKYILKLIEEENLIIDNILKQTFQEDNVNILKKIMFYEYNKRINRNKIELSSNRSQVKWLDITEDSKILCLSNENIEKIKKILKGGKLEVLDFLLKEIESNKLNKLNEKDFFDVYTTISNEKKNEILKNYYLLNTIKNELLKIKYSVEKEFENINSFISTNINFISNFISNFIDFSANESDLENYYKKYYHLYHSEKFLNYLNRKNIRKLNLKKNEIIIGNSGTGKSHMVFNEKNHFQESHTKVVNMTNLDYDYFKEEIVIGLLDYIYSIITDNTGRQTKLLPKHINDITRIVIDESNRNNFEQLINKYNFLIENEPYSKVYEIHKINKEEIIKLKNRYVGLFKQNEEEINKEINTGLLLLKVENFALKEILKRIIEIFFYDESEVEECIVPICSFPGLNFTLIMNTVDFNTKEMDLMLSRRCSIKYLSYKIDNNKKNFKILPNLEEQKLFEEDKEYKYIDWSLLQEILNKIIESHCHDSKCIGYYFWTDYYRDEDDNIIMYEDFKSKIIYYIYGSVLNNFDKHYFKYNIKDEKNDYFFNQKKSFDELMQSKSIIDIFSSDILKKLNLLNEKNKDKIIKIKK